jgi:hypothetical protein
MEARVRLGEEPSTGNDMQFREAGRKIYCSVQYVDPKSRRIRQRVICVLDLFLPRAPDLVEFPFGEADEKAGWLREIEIEISARKMREEQRVLNALPRNFARMVDQIVEAISEKTISQQAIENVRFHVFRLATELGSEDLAERRGPFDSDGPPRT